MAAAVGADAGVPGGRSRRVVRGKRGPRAHQSRTGRLFGAPYESVRLMTAGVKRWDAGIHVPMSTVEEATLLDVDLPAEPRSASRARRAVLDALRGIAVDRDAVGVVVTEAVTNAVLHAYREAPGTVHVSARLDDDGVEVAVDDDGLGMR